MSSRVSIRRGSVDATSGGIDSPSRYRKQLHQTQFCGSKNFISRKYKYDLSSMSSARSSSCGKYLWSSSIWVMESYISGRGSGIWLTESGFWVWGVIF